MAWQIGNDGKFSFGKNIEQSCGGSLYSFAIVCSSDAIAADEDNNNNSVGVNGLLEVESIIDICILTIFSSSIIHIV